MSFDCVDCSRPVKTGDKSLVCSGSCGAFYHLKCLKLKQYDHDLINERPDIHFICEKCLKDLKSLDKIVKELKESVELLKKITEEKNIEKGVEIQKQKSYAEAAKSTVIVKPKEKQDINKTKSDVKDNIKPSELSINFNNISEKKDGSISIICSDEKSRENLCKEVNSKLNEKYIIDSPKLTVPQILLTGMSEMYETSEIEAALKSQNNLKGEVKCVKCYRGIKNTKVFNAIIVLEEEDYIKVMKEGKVCVNWDRCRIFEYISIRKCYNCWGFKHIASKCKNEVACAKCGQNHDTKECKSEEVKCVNCVRSNKLYGLKYDGNHDCRDTVCPVYLKQIEIEKKRASY